MMRLLTILMLFALPAQSAVWYVDNAAGGSNNGTSWGNAWTSFTSINWAGINPGDTIYISGGATSKTYAGLLNVEKSGTSGARITIQTGQDANHNGMVILDGDYVDMRRNYVTLSGNVGGQRRLALNNYFSTIERTHGNKVMADGSIGVIVEYANATNVNQVVSVVGANAFVVRHVVGTDIRGDAAVRAVNCYGSWDANVVENCDFTMSRNSSTGFGPDGIQGSHGLTVRNNIFRVQNVAYETSGQHCDYTQIIGNYIKIHGNEFINIGDSANDFDWWVNPTPHDIWIFNNVYRITTAYDPFPGYIRFYSSSGAVTSLTNFKVMNNTFIDNTGANSQGCLLIAWPSGNMTMTGCQWVNNIHVNTGVFSIPSSAFVAPGDFGFSHNVYATSTSSGFYGTTYNATTWSAIEPTRIVMATPSATFVSYSPGNVNNNLHLTEGDTVARGAGVDLSAYFTTDKDGTPRTGAWSVGAFHGAGGEVNNPPVVSAGADTTISLPTNSTTLSGTASDPDSDPVTVLWSQVSGPASSTITSPTALSTLVTFPAAGTYVLRLTGSDGSLDASDDVTVTVQAGSSILPGLSWPATNGVIAAPYFIAGGYVSQSVETTDPSSGGSARYTFTNAPGPYTVRLHLNAPSGAANSLFVDFNTEPTSPTSIWDVVSLTSGFQDRTATWRGSGTFEVPQFAPQIWTLPGGTNTLIIRGRESGVQFDHVTVEAVQTGSPAAGGIADRSVFGLGDLTL